MRHDKTFIAIVAAPLLGLLIPIAVYSIVRFPASLTAMEKEMLIPPPPVAELKQRQGQIVTGLCCPVKPGAALIDNRNAPVAKSVAFPPIPLPELAPQHKPIATQYPPEKTTVSMILTEEGKRLAIISGKVVKEGDRLGKYTVASIKVDRVLLKDGKEQTWLKIK